MAVMNHELSECIHDALDRVEHTSTVDVFYHSFAAIQCILMQVQPWLPEAYLATRFVYGLRPEYQLFVLRFSPVTVLAAYRLAAIYEESTDIYVDRVHQRVLGVENLSLWSQPTMVIDQMREFLHDALDKIDHSSSVQAYFHSFEPIRELVLSVQPELTEGYFASRFVYGLQEEYQVFVLKYQPTTVAAAYKLALIFEESIYLDYFPEVELSSDEHYGEMIARNNQLEVLHLDSVVPICEGVVAMTFSESTKSIDSNQTNQVEEEAVRTLELSSAVVDQIQDLPASAAAHIASGFSNGSKKGTPYVNCLGDLVSHLIAVGHKVTDVHYISLHVVTIAKEFWGPAIVLIHCRVKHKLICLKRGWPWMKVCHSPCLATNAAPASSSQIFNNTERVLLHLVFFSYHWEPGPLASPWQNDNMGRISHKDSWFLGCQWARETQCLWLCGTFVGTFLCQMKCQFSLSWFEPVVREHGDRLLHVGWCVESLIAAVADYLVEYTSMDSLSCYSIRDHSPRDVVEKWVMYRLLEFAVDFNCSNSETTPKFGWKPARKSTNQGNLSLLSVSNTGQLFTFLVGSTQPGTVVLYSVTMVRMTAWTVGSFLLPYCSLGDPTTIYTTCIQAGLQYAKMFANTKALQWRISQAKVVCSSRSSMTLCAAYKSSPWQLGVLLPWQSVSPEFLSMLRRK